MKKIKVILIMCGLVVVSSIALLISSNNLVLASNKNNQQCTYKCTHNFVDYVCEECGKVCEGLVNSQGAHKDYGNGNKCDGSVKGNGKQR